MSGWLVEQPQRGWSFELHDDPILDNDVGSIVGNGGALREVVIRVSLRSRLSRHVYQTTAPDIAVLH